MDENASKFIHFCCGLCKYTYEYNRPIAQSGFVAGCRPLGLCLFALDFDAIPN